MEIEELELHDALIKSVIADCVGKSVLLKLDCYSKNSRIRKPISIFFSNAIVIYTYDDAHRLTSALDSIGNSMVYTLDLTGNRRKIEVKDPDGKLARQTTRVFDVLNRLQQITGTNE
ncbi:MAG: RHS repeat domain-containing protein [Pseudomonadota bacterium]